MVEPIVTDDEDVYFIDQVMSGVCSEDISDTLERYLNLPESNNPEYNLLNYSYIYE